MSSTLLYYNSMAIMCSQQRDGAVKTSCCSSKSRENDEDIGEGIVNGNENGMSKSVYRQRYIDKGISTSVYRQRYIKKGIKKTDNRSKLPTNTQSPSLAIKTKSIIVSRCHQDYPFHTVTITCHQCHQSPLTSHLHLPQVQVFLAEYLVLYRAVDSIASGKNASWSFVLPNLGNS